MKKIKIFIVEDEPIILRSVRRQIENFGEEYEVIGTSFDGYDAIDPILNRQPDIVITDVVMPQMNSLEMIHKLRKKGVTARFVLLSGYESFEFARQAMEEGVIQYLVKPLNFEKLRECLEELRLLILKEKQEQRKEYFARLRKGKIFSEDHQSFYVVTTLYGCLGRSSYGTCCVNIDNISRTIANLVEQIKAEFGIDLFYLEGFYPNELIFLMSAELVDNENRRMIFEKIYQTLQIPETFLTTIYSNSGVKSLDFQEYIRNIHCELPSRIQFGKNILTDSGRTKNVYFDKEDKETENLIRRFKLAVTEREEQEIIKDCIDYWKKKAITQLELQMSFGRMVRKLFGDKDLDVIEMLYYASSWERLHHIMCQLFSESPHIARETDRRKKLAMLVKEYLDLHFCSDISYKLLGESLGYSEKYISSIFNEYMEMSPSKYVLEKRMTYAKKLLASEPGLRLKDIAEKVGYSDPLYFSRVFKNCEGVSPSAFQQKKSEASYEDRE